MLLPAYPSYQLPPQVQALSQQPADAYLSHPKHPPVQPNSVAQAQQPLTPDQQAAVNGTGPDIFPATDPRAQFLAGAQQGLAGGLRRFPVPATPGTPQPVNQAPDPAARQFPAQAPNPGTGMPAMNAAFTGGPAPLPPQVSALANQPLDNPDAVVAPPTPGTPQWLAQQQQPVGGSMNGGRWNGMPYQTR